MIELTQEEYEIFNKGNDAGCPSVINEGGFCFHLCVWFLTGKIPSLPEWPNYNQHTRGYLDENHVDLHLSPPLFECNQRESMKPLEYLRELPDGGYLVHLLDVKEWDNGRGLGHWAVVKRDGVFDPGPGRKDILLDDWITIFKARYMIRRIFPIEEVSPEA